MEQKILIKIFILIIGVSFFSGTIQAETDTLFDYESLYLSGRYDYIIDSLSNDDVQAGLLKARTLVKVGYFKEATEILDNLGLDFTQLASLYFRMGDFKKASEAAASRPDSGFSSIISLYILARCGHNDDSLTNKIWHELANSSITLFKSASYLNLAIYLCDKGMVDSAQFYLDSLNYDALGHKDKAEYHILKSKISFKLGDSKSALKHIETALKSNHLFEHGESLIAFAVDSMAADFDYRQTLRLAEILRHKRYYEDAIALLSKIEPNDTVSLETGWCHFGLKYYNKALEIFQSLSQSSDPDILAESAYGQAVCYYRRGRRLDGVNRLLEFAEAFPEHKLAPRALFTAGDFYQRSDYNKSIEIFGNLVTHYGRSSYYPRSLYLISSQHLMNGARNKALEVLANFAFGDDSADLFDYWQFKLSPADSSLLRGIIDRKYASFYNYKARQNLSMDKSDTIISYNEFYDDFLDRARQFISWREKKKTYDSSAVAIADSFFYYGLEYEAGLHLIYLHEKEKNLLLDIELLKKSYKLKLAGVFFAILDDFKTDLQRKGYSFNHDTWQRLSYPFLFRDLINFHAKDKIDPYLALSVIRRESRFDPMAVSSVGALGLMQLMPATAAQMAKLDEVPVNWLFEPGYNIMLGCSYLRWLAVRLKRDEIVIAAYNAGPTAAKRWKRLAGTDTETYIETIGYDQSRRYTRWVIGDHFWYRYFWPVDFD